MYRMEGVFFFALMGARLARVEGGACFIFYIQNADDFNTVTLVYFLVC
jgi:hypothetical protein